MKKAKNGSATRTKEQFPGVSPRKISPEILERRRLVWAAYTRKMNQQQIAKQLGVDQSTVSRDLKALWAEFHEATVTEMEKFRQRELAELQEMERDCILDFQRTRDPRFQRLRLDIKARIAVLMGLNAPTKMAPTTPDGTESYDPNGGTGESLASRIDSIAARLREAESLVGPGPDAG